MTHKRPLGLHVTLRLQGRGSTTSIATLYLHRDKKTKNPEIKTTQKINRSFFFSPPIKTLLFFNFLWYLFPVCVFQLAKGIGQSDNFISLWSYKNNNAFFNQSSSNFYSFTMLEGVCLPFSCKEILSPSANPFDTYTKIIYQKHKKKNLQAKMQQFLLTWDGGKYFPYKNLKKLGHACKTKQTSHGP